MGKNYSYIVELRGRAHVVQIAYILNILIFLNIHAHVAHVAYGLIRLNFLNIFTERRTRSLNHLARINNPHDHWRIYSRVSYA